ncbi:copper resistance CopC/CopD family protein [Ilumatobacter sp.]|uniref:copper resistance CopC/CopD family protein n=1 Tax=Ilumatobacter sp. TaxID=1967498 RepID=UPI003C467ED2
MTAPTRSSTVGSGLFGLLVVLAVVMVLAIPGVAAAHATLIAIDPADGVVLADQPSAVTLTFNEPVSVSGGVAVYDRDGRRIADDAEATNETIEIALPDDLATGTYLVTWDVLSADSHRVTGSSTFSIGAPSAGDPPDVASITEPATAPGTAIARVAATACWYLASITSLGLAFFGHRWRRLAGSGAPDSIQRRAITQASRRLASVGVLASVGILASRTAELSGEWSAVVSWTSIRSVVGGPIGTGLLAVVTGLVALFAAQRVRANARFTTTLLWVGGALVLIGFTADGHTRSAEPTWLAIASDAIHVSAGAVWIGGIAALGISRSSTDSTAWNRRTLIDVSTCAIVAVTAVFAAGVVLAVLIVPSVGALVSTTWGLALIVKSSLVLGLVGFGAYNRFVLVPVRGIEEEEFTPRRELRLRRTIGAELALFTLVLATTGFLVGASPLDTSSSNTQQSVEAIRETVPLSSGTASVRFDLAPATVGRNDLNLAIQAMSDGLDDPAPEFIEEPVIQLRDLSGRIGPIDLAVHTTGPGNYHVVTDVPFAGDWRLEVRARTGDFESGIAWLDVSIQ